MGSCCEQAPHLGKGCAVIWRGHLHCQGWVWVQVATVTRCMRVKLPAFQHWLCREGGAGKKQCPQSQQAETEATSSPV